jgi:hypothetical protein
MSDAPALVRERQRSLLAEHASPADRASADTSELPTAALFRRSGRITVESRACLVVLKLASLLGRREDSRAPTSPSDATRSWSTARSASAGTPGSPIRCPHPPRRRLQALPAERGGPGHTDPIRGMCGRRVRGFAIDLIPELVRTGRARGSRAQSPRNRRGVGSLTTGLPESPRKKSWRRCRIGAEVFVAGVRGRPRGRPETTGDDPRCSTWFP